MPVHLEAAGVLKITRLLHQGGDLTIKLEGQLLSPWISTVREACACPEGRLKSLRLDLGAISFVDSAGLQLLRDLLREGIEIGTCSRFISESLRRQQADKPEHD
jgi:ABC-type transporter Mla MlaB component